MRCVRAALVADDSSNTPMLVVPLSYNPTQVELAYIALAGNIRRISALFIFTRAQSSAPSFHQP